MVSLPVYKRGSVYYLHTRDKNNKQIKISLRTPFLQEARVKAIEILGDVMIKKFEVDISAGRFKTDGTEEDVKALTAFLKSAEYRDATKRVDRLAIEKEQAKEKTNLEIREREAQIPKLSDVLEQMIQFKELKPSTAKSYRERLQKFINIQKDLQVHQVTKEKVLKVQEKLLLSTVLDVKISRRSIDLIIQVVRSVMNFAKDRNYIKDHEIKDIKDLATKQEKKKNSYKNYTQSEIEKIIEEFEKEKSEKKGLKQKNIFKRFYVVFLLSLLTGARVSEVAGLKVGDIKRDAKNRPYFEVSDSKTAKGVRLVPFPEQVFKMGLDEIIANPGIDSLFGYKKSETKGYGNPVSNSYRRLLNKAGVIRKGLTFHSLRKFFNSYLHDNDITLEIREQMLGHENEGENSRTYTDYTVEKLADKVNPIQEKLISELF